MALVTLSQALAFLEMSADDSYNTVQSIIDGVDSSVKAHCNRDFESTSYKEVIEVSGVFMMTPQFPVISVSRISTGRTPVIKIKNTNEYTYANVLVSSTGVTLNYNGTANTLTFASYATVGSLVTAINLLGNGWVAEEYDGRSSVLSSEIVEFSHKNAINSNYVDLDIFYESLNISNYDNSIGYFLFNKIVRGEVYISYTAGYASTPTDIKFAVLNWIKHIYTKHQDGGIGLSQYSIERMEKIYEDIPAEAKLVLDKHKKVLI